MARHTETHTENDTETVNESHMLLGGKVRVYKRDRSTRYWQCSANFDGRKYRTSTKQDSLQLAKEFAEDWYLGLRGKKVAGLLKHERTFKDVAEQFLKEYTVITEGDRSEKWVESHPIRLRLHLNPFFGDLGLSEITAGKVQEYRVFRMTPTIEKNPFSLSNHKMPKDIAHAKIPSRSTLHDEIGTLRLVLKTAIRHGWLTGLPELSPPYKSQGKVVHRPWFSPAEYKQLYEATRKHAAEAKANNKWNADQVHDFVLFMGNTGLRPDEAMNLQHRDVEIVIDEATEEEILVIEVRGKRGIGFCKSTPNAVRPYQRLKSRPKPPSKEEEEGEKTEKEELPEPHDLVFPGDHRKLFDNVLKKAKLKFDRDDKSRTAYSLRHTYICMRLMEGADIYQIAKTAVPALK